MCYDIFFLMIKDFDLQFEHLQIFHKLCLTQSFASICEEFNLNHTELINSIKELEAELNSQLISNFFNPFTLTESGKKLFSITTRLAFEIVDMENSLKIKHQAIKNNHVNILVSTSNLFSSKLAQKTNYILERIPEVFIDISFHDNLTLDKFNKKDIFISTGPFVHELAENYTLDPIPMSLAVSKKYLHQHGIPKFISSMKNHKFIWTACYDYHKMFKQHQLKHLSKQYMIDSEYATVHAIQSGFGIGIMPKFLCYEFPELILFELEQTLGDLNLTLSVPKLKKTSYIDLLLEILANEITIPHYDKD